jgi:hypothetical protein
MGVLEKLGRLLAGFWLGLLGIAILLSFHICGFIASLAVGAGAATLIGHGTLGVVVFFGVAFSPFASRAPSRFQLHGHRYAKARLADHRTSNPRVGSSNLSERASEIKDLVSVVAYRFCAWETVGKLLQAVPPPHDCPPKKFRKRPTRRRP